MESTQKEKLDPKPLAPVLPILFLCLIQMEIALLSVTNKRVLTDKFYSSLLLLQLDGVKAEAGSYL